MRALRFITFAACICWSFNVAAQILPLVIDPCPTAADGESAPLRADGLSLMRAELLPTELRVLDAGELDQADRQAAFSLQVCAERARIVWHTESATSQVQEIDLSGLDEEARARTLAHALSGVVSLRRSPSLPATATPEAKNPPVAPILVPQQAKRPPERPGLAMDLDVHTRVFGSPFTIFSGPSLSVRHDRYAAGATILLSGQSHRAGRVFAAIAAASGRVTLLSKGARRRFDLDLQGEIGATWSSGSAVFRADRPSRVATWAGLGLKPRLTVAVAGRSSFTLALAAGYARGLLTSIDGKAVASSHGPYAGLTLGFALARPI